MSNFFMVPSENSGLGVTISTEMRWDGVMQKVRVVHIYEIDTLLPILQLLNKTVDIESMEAYNHTDLDWLFLDPFMDGESAFSNIIYKAPNGNVKIIGVIYLASHQTTILRAIKHSLNDEKKVGK